MQSAVIIFPGSNCDRDMYTTIENVTGKQPHKVWHADSKLPEGLDFIAIPGGFSYGDYLRCGAMAARSPIMSEVIKSAKKGLYILGVCNGFQILTETGLLPGTLMRNRNLKFICRTVNLQVANNDSSYTTGYKQNQVIKVPIAHGEGNFFADGSTLQEIENEGQVAFRYCTQDGKIEDQANPNGSLNNIAGIFSKNKRILGMMPHPERASDPLTGSSDGKILFQKLLGAA